MVISIFRRSNLIHVQISIFAGLKHPTSWCGHINSSAWKESPRLIRVIWNSRPIWSRAKILNWKIILYFETISCEFDSRWYILVVLACLAKSREKMQMSWREWGLLPSNLLAASVAVSPSGWPPETSLSESHLHQIWRKQREAGASTGLLLCWQGDAVEWEEPEWTNKREEKSFKVVGCQPGYRKMEGEEPKKPFRRQGWEHSVSQTLSSTLQRYFSISRGITRLLQRRCQYRLAFLYLNDPAIYRFKFGSNLLVIKAVCLSIE